LNDWSIAAGESRTFHYRIEIFRGKSEPEKLGERFKAFASDGIEVER
jgi:hypothetical protein